LATGRVRVRVKFLAAGTGRVQNFCTRRPLTGTCLQACRRRYGSRHWTDTPVELDECSETSQHKCEHQENEIWKLINLVESQQQRERVNEDKIAELEKKLEAMVQMKETPKEMQTAELHDEQTTLLSRDTATQRNFLPDYSGWPKVCHNMADACHHWRQCTSDIGGSSLSSSPPHPPPLPFSHFPPLTLLIQLQGLGERCKLPHHLEVKMKRFRGQISCIFNRHNLKVLL